MKKNNLFPFLTFFISSIIFGQNPIIGDDYIVEKLSGGFEFTEGPTPDKNGNVYFSDISTKTIHKWSVDGKLSVVTDSISGCNGLIFDKNEILYICGNSESRNVMKMNLQTNIVEVITDNFEGKKYNGPNDLWIHEEHGIYFSDPIYGNNRTDVEIKNEEIYLITPKNKVVQITNGLKKPNGLIGDSKRKILYVADWDAKKVYKYKIGKNGVLTNRSTFIEGKVVDGMTLDGEGNLYIAADDIEVYSKEGKYLWTYEIPENASNICFGGENNAALYVTARKGLYIIKRHQ